MKYKIGGSLSEGQKYSFTDPSNYYNIQFRYFMKNLKCWFEFDDTFEGSIIYTKIDRKNFILSGEFEFSAVNDECDTVYITDGRFDMQYNRSEEHTSELQSRGHLVCR